MLGRQSSWFTEGRGQLYARVDKEEESDTLGQPLTPDIPEYPEPNIQASINSSSEDNEITNRLLRTSEKIVQHQKPDEESPENSCSYQSGGSEYLDHDGYHRSDGDLLAVEDDNFAQTSPAVVRENDSWILMTEHEIERNNAVKKDGLWVRNNSMWRGIDLSIFDDMNLV
ncbi:hypothetical protein N7481_011112 [Penicillium waksmanii]|uniref:uncharacterized protein n=1 Tax=Penicillium waksmanii TaxID=69791 RepID=UPI0025474C63|nr:uncharacterized protein N7481_011112 [Penicillium waksmanii]KAJ5973902.1 hypothetical protein N7481_011112 [Penicillium waksmanii]